MTNQPLTAEEISTVFTFNLSHTYSGNPDKLGPLIDKYQKYGSIRDAVKAYAAQQNAELVAENEALGSLLRKRTKQYMAMSGLYQKEGYANELLQAENERLNTYMARLWAHASEFLNSNNWSGNYFTNSGAVESLHDTLNTTEVSVKAWQAKERNEAYQNGYAEAERLGNIEIEGLKEALKSIIEVDKTIYKHHEPRPDGRLPKENGGTIWFTPKEIAKMVLPQPPKEAT